MLQHHVPAGATASPDTKFTIVLGAHRQMLGNFCPVGRTAESELNQLIDTVIGNGWRYLL